MSNDTVTPDSPSPAATPQTTPQPGYKPSMIYTSKCIRCGHLIRAFGYFAFNEACEQHFANCPEKKGSDQ